MRRQRRQTSLVAPSARSHRWRCLRRISCWLARPPSFLPTFRRRRPIKGGAEHDVMGGWDGWLPTLEHPPTSHPCPSFECLRTLPPPRRSFSDTHNSVDLSPCVKISQDFRHYMSAQQITSRQALSSLTLGGCSPQAHYVA